MLRTPIMSSNADGADDNATLHAQNTTTTHTQKTSPASATTTHTTTTPTRPTVAIIDLAALDANFREAARLAAGRAVIAIVKADAYGHGAVAVARRLLARGCEHFAVATLAEAAALRAAGVRAPLLVFDGAQTAAQADAAIALGVTPALHDFAALNLLSARARAVTATNTRALPVQVEVDTGMRRAGVPAADAPALLAAVARAPGLALAGVYTHLACADEASLASTRAQLAAFARVLAAARARGVTPGLVHVANSAALLAGPELADALPAAVNAVRPGLLLYGVAPTPVRARRARLAPVMSLRTRIRALRAVAAGDAVGYGAHFRAPTKGRVATLPVGYADGLPRAATGRVEVLLRGRRVRIAGQVSMDLTTVFLGGDGGANQILARGGDSDASDANQMPAPADAGGVANQMPAHAGDGGGDGDGDGQIAAPAGDATAAVGDSVLLFGVGEDGARLPVETLAACCDTIAYEILVRVGARVPRICVG